MAMDKSRGAAAGKTMDKKAALETALAQIEKQFGKGAVMRLGQNEAMHVEAIPTGSAFPGSGARASAALPRGRIVEIYGPGESSGKTTAGAALHRRGRRSAAATRRSSTWSTPSTRSTPGRWAWTWTACWSPSRIPASRRWRSREALVRSGAIDVIVVDSVAALVPQGGDRGRDGRLPRRPAGAPDEPGAAQAGGCDLQIQLRGDLHQPAAREGGRRSTATRRSPPAAGR